MLKEERQHYILQRVNAEGRAVTNELKETLGVSEDTIRKDFQELARTGKVQRIHGGVLRLDNTLQDFNIRKEYQSSIKKQLAERAVDLVLEKEVLYIDSGTTNLALAAAISDRYTGTCITNSLTIALQLCECNGANVILLGGGIEKTNRQAMGTSAIHQLEQMNIECCIIGVSSLSAEHGITYPLYEEALLKQTALRKSKTAIVIATKEKLGTISTFYCADLSAIDYLITNETDPAVLDQYAQFGMEIIPVDLTQ